MPEKGLFLQNVIALIWDFDKTLSPHNMQKPIFEAYEIEEAQFWREVNALPAYYGRAKIDVHEDTCYLGHLLSYVRHGKMPGLTNAKLRELGGRIELFPGLPECFDRLKGALEKPAYRDADIRLENYIVSTGLRAMIEGSKIAGKVNGIWASGFIEEAAGPDSDLDGGTPGSGEIGQIAGLLDNTTKTRAIFEINKGVNMGAGISVNDTIAEEDRRVPFKNMIYIADGPSDIPSFSVIRRNGGLAFAVYDPAHQDRFEQAVELQETRRVNDYGVADYTETSETYRWLSLHVRKIADRMIAERTTATKSRVRKGPSH
ncbi:MAG: HAD family hydrolase [Candidatus Hydrogenedentes bacterium]|nr:HAD family hydrolase [Candidatus Hydrogenedentota bacterium]